MKDTILYTIGYAHHTQESFLALLQNYQVNCVVDVRTMAYSGFHPQFNKEVIRHFLKQHGILYLHMPEAFGIIKGDRRLNTVEGYVDFTKLAALPTFKAGIERIENGIRQGYHIAFMCAEKDPLDCHRTTLVAREFHERGYGVMHILHDGKVQEHEALEKKMKDRFAPLNHQLHLFEKPVTPGQRLEEAYARCSKEIFITNAKRVLKKDYDYPKPYRKEDKKD